MGGCVSMKSRGTTAPTPMRRWISLKNSWKSNPTDRSQLLRPVFLRPCHSNLTSITVSQHAHIPHKYSFMENYQYAGYSYLPYLRRRLLARSRRRLSMLVRRRQSRHSQCRRIQAGTNQQKRREIVRSRWRGAFIQLGRNNGESTHHRQFPRTRYLRLRGLPRRIDDTHSHPQSIRVAVAMGRSRCHTKRSAQIPGLAPTRGTAVHHPCFEWLWTEYVGPPVRSINLTKYGASQAPGPRSR